MKNTWVRAYRDNSAYFYVSTEDLFNFRVSRNYLNTAWIIFADPKFGREINDDEIALLGTWSTEAAAGEALKELLGGVDLSS